MSVSINTVELKDILDMTPSSHNIMLVGKHGIGKSRIITEYFKSKKRNVVTLFLGQMSDPGDIIGLPALNSVTGKTEFRLPWWFPENDEPLVLFLDELNRARPEILQCVMDLTLNKAIVGRKLPDGAQIIAAVNEGEEYQLTDLDPALISRFNLYTFAPTVPEWLLWAEKARVDKRIIGFISHNPLFLDGEIQDGLTKTSDRRAWERVSEILNARAEVDTVAEKAIAGIVGSAAAVKFTAYCKSETGIDPLIMLANFDDALPALKKAKVHELTTLSEGCFRLLEAETDTGRRAIFAMNFERYINWLDAGRHREAIAHWTALFDTDAYPRAKISLMTYAPKLMARITQYIKDIEL